MSIQGFSRLRRTRTKWELAKEASPTCLKGCSNQAGGGGSQFPYGGYAAKSSLTTEKKTPPMSLSPTSSSLLLPLPHGHTMDNVRNIQHHPPTPKSAVHLAVKRKIKEHPPPPPSPDVLSKCGPRPPAALSKTMGEGLGNRCSYNGSSKYDEIPLPIYLGTYVYSQRLLLPDKATCG